MKAITTKIEKALDFIEQYKRNYDYKNLLCINIKYTNYPDFEEIKNALNKIYNIEIINEINFDSEFDFFIENETGAFFEYARELFDNEKVYQYGRSGGWLGVDLYDYIEEKLANMQNDLDNNEFYYYGSKKDMHDDMVWNIINKIKSNFDILKDYHNNFFKNIDCNFTEYLKENTIQCIENKIKEKFEKYNKLNNLINN